jgi:O-acetyl-ADP-ribose deacetylase (regulator of RNase III)
VNGDWRQPSSEEWVEKCLRSLLLLSEAKRRDSLVTVALPLIGAGLGRVSEDFVLQAAAAILEASEVKFTLFVSRIERSPAYF